MSRICKAITFMKSAHRSIKQTRKDGIRPYEVHPLEVMARVAAVENNEDILIAALLHDVIEDVFPLNDKCDVYLIANTFGDVAAKLVVELTDIYTKEAWPDLNRAKRKQAERERYGTLSANAKLIKLADITTNLLDDGNVTNDGSFGGPA
jgi:guanosine-3',5'-bis(diphosphate) 3'-pyrophosphohydrolase